MYCENCGNEVMENAVVCPKCNEKIFNDSPAPKMCLLAVLIPIAGIIFGFINLKSKPQAAKVYIFVSIAAVFVWSFIVLGLCSFFEENIITTIKMK